MEESSLLGNIIIGKRVSDLLISELFSHLFDILILVESTSFVLLYVITLLPTSPPQYIFALLMIGNTPCPRKKTNWKVFSGTRCILINVILINDEIFHKCLY